MSKADWISIKEAVDLLGSSDKTVRRRIKAKRYRSRYVEGAFGDELRLRKEDVLKDVQTSDDPGQGAASQYNSEDKENCPGQLAGADSEKEDAVGSIEERTTPRVLLVDKSKRATDYLKRILKRRNIEVVVAGDGETGLRLMGEEQPDLAIIEIAIPKMDGFELVTAKDKRKEIKHIPVIFYSYLLREYSLVQEARSYPGVIGCFRKPLAGEQMEEFRKLIKEMAK